MKVTGPTGSAPATSSRPAARAAGGFALPSTGGAGGASQAAATSAASGVGGVSALMALQGVEDATERRRRAVRRGGGLLDRLEDLKLAMLGGEAGEAALAGLGRTLAEDRPADIDPGLSSLLDQIDLRARVELAKAELRRQAR